MILDAGRGWETISLGIVPENLDKYESTLDSPAFDLEGIDGRFLLNRVTQEDFFLKYGMIANGSRKAKRIHEDTFLAISNGRKAMEVETYNSKYVVEVVSFADHRAFLKIGQQNSANTVALRDRNTLETEDVPMRDSQLLELYTFCLIDFETGIISYIGINGAPRISAIRNMFYNSLYKERKIRAVFAAILTDDIIEQLVRKSIISKISVTVAVPSDEVLSSSMGLDAASFDALRNVKTRTATYNITGKRNKNIFESSSKLAELIADLRSKFGDNIQALSARAKDHDEKSQNYDLLQYNFTKTVSLGDVDSSILGVDDFREALTTTYETYKDELLRYSRI